MRTLLIADDERTIREGIANAIDWESLGISSVMLAANGQEAFDTIVNQQPDIVIIDIIMPEMTGIEVIDYFSKGSERPEFVIISGYDEFHYAQAAVRYHVNEYLLKPCNPQEIKTTVEQIVARLDQRQSLAEAQLHMQEHLNLIIPQAKEQILRNFLIDNSVNNQELLRELFEQDGLKQLVLFTGADSTYYPRLHAFKRCIDETSTLLGWSVSAIIKDAVVLVFNADAAGRLSDLMMEICKLKLGLPPTGMRGILSDQVCIDELPNQYQEALEASRHLAPSVAWDLIPKSIPLIDVCMAYYSEPVQQGIIYVNDNLDDDSLTLNHIATAVLFVNPDYLGRLFRKELGIKFSDYLLRLRMEKAKQLINNSVELKVYEVAEQVGFGDRTAYFSQVFRKYTGMLPSEYKSMLTSYAKPRFWKNEK